MAPCFCCGAIQPYRPQRLDHEAKFTGFMRWAQPWAGDEAITGLAFSNGTPNYAVQLVCQVNYGPIESKRYFVPAPEQGDGYVEATERELIENNFQKLNSYKNFKCIQHNKFFEVNLYQKDPFNKHHWRSNIARPADSIDL